MRRTRRVVVAVILTAATFATAASSSPASAAPQPRGAGEVAAGRTVVTYANSGAPAPPARANAATAPADAVASAGPATATFIVTYNNFSAQAKAAFDAAVNVWSHIITSSVPIRVDATWTPLGTNVLGAAGPDEVIHDFDHAPMANTWYPIALANALAGADLDASRVDIDASFNSAFGNWYLGTDGNAGGAYDFETIVLHELGHGLGFIGSMNVSTSTGRGSFGTSGLPWLYDRFAENGAGQSLLAFGNNTTTLAAQLQSGSVFFDAVRADAANCGSRPRLFAPLSWQPGSSFSHLDEDTYPSTDVESLMTPVFDPGEVHHTVGRITRGIFSDLGWNVVNDTPAFPCLAPVAFGNVFTRGTVTGNAVLTNVGGQPLTVTGGVAPAPPFSATPPTNPTIVNAGQSIAIPVQFDATTLGFYSSSLTITTLSGNPSAAVTGAARSHTDTESFVDAAYFDFLGRLPSSGELSYWSGQLESGQTSRNGFLNLLSTSNEWVNAIVTDFYWKTLGRMPDASGLSYWTGVIQNRTLTVAQVAAQFYASNEYYNGFGGGTDSGWVHDLYIKILHREPDSTGLNYWVGVTQQQGRVAVAYAFYQSSESAHDRVADLYSKLLGRAPDPAGWDYWSQVVVTYGDLTLATTLAGSAEYAQRAITRFP